VFDHLSSRCSARRHCVVPIPAPELFKVHPCRKDLVAYMDATYQCVTGLAARTLFTRHLCSRRSGGGGALSDSAIRPSVCPSVCPMAQLL